VGRLEIRSKSSGEELHRITVATGTGEVTCLHWVAGKPPDIDADQVRYSLTDHLGSSVTELDQNARLISQEGYFTFGGTAWMAADRLVEVDYKFIRYSGKEMDRSGLYYYGARYYASWLCRWVSADPAGDVDGLNRYAFVGNNPLSYFDSGGTTRTPSELRHIVAQQIKFLGSSQQNLNNVKKQFSDLTSPADFRLKILKNFIFLAGRAAVGFFAGYHTTGQTFAESSTPGELQGMSLGNFSADRSGAIYTKLMSPLKLDTPILPRSADLDPASIRNQSAGISPGPLSGLTFNPTTWPEKSENIRTLFSLGRDAVGGAIIPGVSELAELYHVAKDATKAEQLLGDWELNAYDTMLDELEKSIGNAADAAHEALNELGVEQTYTNATDHLIDIGRGKVGTKNARMTSRSDIQKHKSMALQSLQEVRAMMTRYRTYVSQQKQSRAA
jgi:insecticidal toxin complex protein TccC